MADDHTLLRDAVAAVIDGFNNCKVILRAKNGAELIESLKIGHIPDLLLLDLNMPVMDGYETAQYLFKHYPDIRILTLTMYEKDLPMIRLLQMGVRGFLKKDTPPRKLHEAIISTMQTGYYYSGNATIKLMNLLKNDSNNTPQINSVNLSEHEITFLELASTEMTYKEISVEMKVSPRTVDSYRDTLFTKLRVKSRVGLAMYAVANGIVNVRY